MSTRILSVIALTTLLGACASPSPSAPLSAQSLQHHHWVLEKIDGLPLLAEKGKAPDLEIGEQLRANGSAGCNRYFGQVELQGSQLRIKQMAANGHATRTAVQAAGLGALDAPLSRPIKNAAARNRDSGVFALAQPGLTARTSP